MCIVLTVYFGTTNLYLNVAGCECETRAMAWSPAAPTNGSFSPLRNLTDGDLSSSDECLVYTPGGANKMGGPGGSFTPASASNAASGNHVTATAPVSVSSLPSNHQANIAHNSAIPLSSGG